MTLILEIKKLYKSFGGLEALKDISFNIDRDEIIGLIGPNGAGKTTLFNCVAGIEKPTAGKIILTKEDRTITIGGKKPEAVTALGILVIGIYPQPFMNLATESIQMVGMIF